MHSSSDLPPFDALAAMLAAARTGSFSAAADELGLTHGAVSRRVQAVESWLGVAVFERHGRGVRLSATGEHFAREVEQALARIAEAAADFRSDRRAAKLRISVLPSFARLWLMPRLGTLQAACRGSAIRLLVEHRVASLEGGEADLAIRYGRGRWAGVESTLLLAERAFAVAAPAVARALRGRGPEAVLDELLLHDSDTRLWRAWCDGAGLRYRPRGGERRFDDYDLLLAAAEGGLGVAIARWPLAAAALEAGRLVRLHGPEFDAPKAHYLVSRSGETRRDVRALADALLAQAQAPTPAATVSRTAK
jgi:DNA-binding transcriptional LysR family regulator